MFQIHIVVRFLALVTMMVTNVDHRKITKAKLRPFLINLFIKIMKKKRKRGKGNFGQVRAILGKFRPFWANLGKLGLFWASLGKFGKVWASLGKLGQVRTRQMEKKRQKE